MMQKERDWQEKKKHRKVKEVDLTESGDLVWDRRRRWGGKWEGQQDEEREARLLGLFAVIGGALTR